MKNSNDTIGIQTRDLPVRSAVPQPTAPPAACPILPYKWFQTAQNPKQSLGSYQSHPDVSISPPYRYNFPLTGKQTECQTIHEYAFNIQLQSRIDIHPRNIHMGEHIRNTYILPLKSQSSHITTGYNLHYSIVKLIATSRKEHRLCVFENRVLRNILGPKRDEVTQVEKTT